MIARTDAGTFFRQTAVDDLVVAHLPELIPDHECPHPVMPARCRSPIGHPAARFPENVIFKPSREFEENFTGVFRRRGDQFAITCSLELGKVAARFSKCFRSPEHTAARQGESAGK